MSEEEDGEVELGAKEEVVKKVVERLALLRIEME